MDVSKQPLIVMRADRTLLGADLARVTLSHRCDSCPARSTAVAMIRRPNRLPRLPLEFCGHHLNRHRRALLAAKAAILPLGET